MIRVPAILLAGIVMTACATAPRDDPAAPVVQVTPRDPVVEAPKPVAPAPPAAPAKQPTRVFAYRDPAVAPDPEPIPAPIPTPMPGAAPEIDVPAPPAAQPPPVLAQQPSAPTPQASNVSEPPPATPPATPPVAEPPPVDVAAAPASPAVPGLPPAADALARQAEQQRQSGDYAGAAASLERSLRIAPREAYLWNRLARVRLEQGQSGQAGNLAARSNDLAGDTPAIKQDNWRIIAEARRRSGDITGASEAEQRASGN